MISIIKENFSFFKKTVKLSINDLIKIYKGAALGPIWALVKPTFLIFIYWFAFEYGLRKAGNVNGHPFVFWLISGYLPWLYMSDVINAGSTCLRAYKQFVTKMPFPVSTIITFVNLSRLYIHVLLLIIVAVIFLGSGYKVDIYWLQLLYYIPMMFLFFTALSWATASLSAISKDFQNLMKSVITGLFWVSGVIWDSRAMKPGLIQALVFMNPVNYFINGFRDIFLYKQWFFERIFETESFLIIFCLTVVIGSRIYIKLRKYIPDVL